MTCWNPQSRRHTGDHSQTCAHVNIQLVGGHLLLTTFGGRGVTAPPIGGFRLILRAHVWWADAEREPGGSGGRFRRAGPETGAMFPHHVLSAASGSSSPLLLPWSLSGLAWGVSPGPGREADWVESWPPGLLVGYRSPRPHGLLASRRPAEPSFLGSSGKAGWRSPAPFRADGHTR